MRPHYYDGMRMSDSKGRHQRVFEPRWWEWRRWLLLLRYRFGWLRNVWGERVSIGKVNITSGNDVVRVRVVGSVRIR